MVVERSGIHQGCGPSFTPLAQRLTGTSVFSGSAAKRIYVTLIVFINMSPSYRHMLGFFSPPFASCKLLSDAFVC